MTPNNTSEFLAVFQKIHYMQFVQAILLFVVGIIIAKIIGLTVARLSKPYLSTHATQIIRKSLKYLILSIFILAALQQLGFSISILIGAAGVLTVALGFASQLSVSNLISGLFLIAEKPFRIGEVINVNNITGEVVSIDALSIKLRTGDENTLARIPNETLIKSTIINFSRLPMRRFELHVGVDYKTDAQTIRQILLNVADQNTYALKMPAPSAIILNLGDSSVNWRLAVFVMNEHYDALKTSLFEAVLAEFAKNQINIPFPTRTIYSNAVIVEND